MSNKADNKTLRQFHGEIDIEISCRYVFRGRKTTYSITRLGYVPSFIHTHVASMKRLKPFYKYLFIVIFQRNNNYTTASNLIITNNFVRKSLSVDKEKRKIRRGQFPRKTN